MRINRLAATYGRLENASLDLAPGLNVIQAPNEGGKSTWTSLLRVMLYGLNTRDRSETADKRRYLPWSGSPMEGAMDLTDGPDAVTVIRRTARANSPMGAFSAVYTGTATPVPGLTAANCGEVLLGVPQDVFVRSAFISQSGMSLDQNSALERRITSLISTGEEDTSYTDADARLRKLLNARRSSRSTGQLPQLEREIRELQDTLSAMDALSDSLERGQTGLLSLQSAANTLRLQLSQHDEADRYDQLLAARTAQQRYTAAQAQTAALERAAARYPSKSDLLTCQADLRSLEHQTRAAAEARRAAEAAAAQLSAAEEPLRAHPLAGKTPEEAARLAQETEPRPRLSPLIPVLALLSALLLAGILSILKLPPVAAVIAGLAALVLVLAGGLLSLRARQGRWDARLAQEKEARAAGLAAYTILYEKAEAARDAARSAEAGCRAADTACRAALSELLAKVRAFQPSASDHPGIDRAITDALAVHDRLETARAAEAAARLEWEHLPKPDGDLPPSPPVRPPLDRDTLRTRLANTQDQLRELDRTVHTAQGRLEAMGDRAELSVALAEKTARRDTLQAEYDAIALAMEVLASANASLQTRFSPALGKRAAEVFTKLTSGKYNKVLLDRDMIPSAQSADQLLPHSAAFLSQGTADQLYLAVRLAICDLVLPPEKAVPIVLDDALVTFDDRRLAAALDCLTELSRTRQILLFTCQRREADYLRAAHPDQFHLQTL